MRRLFGIRGLQCFWNLVLEFKSASRLIIKLLNLLLLRLEILQITLIRINILLLIKLIDIIGLEEVNMHRGVVELGEHVLLAPIEVVLRD